MTWWPTVSDGALRIAKEMWIYEWRNVIHNSADRRHQWAVLAGPGGTRPSGARDRQGGERGRVLLCERRRRLRRVVRAHVGGDQGVLRVARRREDALLHRAVQMPPGLRPSW